ncbi:hypothetical protein BDF14DRAFT_1771372 [Spinellus fusiger]|nr:hypothetical protein BDF14DRAFT_1771372 [Spinellus fusiger]
MDISPWIKDGMTPGGMVESLLGQLSTADHQHVFCICLSTAPHEQETTEERQQQIVEEKPPVICRICHWRLILTSDSMPCTAPDYPTHHYHMERKNTASCCGCHRTVQATLQPPMVPLALLKTLATTRIPYTTLAHRLNTNYTQVPTLETTFETYLQYIKDLVQGQYRKINTKNPRLSVLIGMEDASLELFGVIGFQLQEEYLIPPSSAHVENHRKTLLLIQHELTLSYEVNKNPSTSNGSSLTSYSATPHLLQLLGGEPTSSQRIEAYRALGTTPSAHETVVAWLYRLNVLEHPHKAPLYLDRLVEAAEASKCEVLVTLVAMERSQGRVGNKEIAEAHAYFGIAQEMPVEDGLLVGLYHVKMLDDPQKKAVHRHHLEVLACWRKSDYLDDFLMERVLPTNIPAAVHWDQSLEGTPIGLNNIGNTCYFNSLLQYYFTLVPIRNSVITLEEYTENEARLPDISIQVGGIKVDSAQVRRAKKFVSLLKRLFIDLTNTSKRAISPEYDLACMALLNESESEALEKKAESETKAEKKEEEEKEEKVKEEEEVATETEPPSTFRSSRMSIGTLLEGYVDPSKDNEKEWPINESLADLIEDSKHVKASEPTSEGTPCHNPKHSIDLPPAYDSILPTLKEKQPPPVPQTLSTKTIPNIATIMFGKQQDVTECMGNVIQLIETALLSATAQQGEKECDMVRDLFYGKASQILTYQDTETSQIITKVKKEEFSHLIVDAVQGKDLYDGLDEYFFAGKVENFQGGKEATREVTVSAFPPILQIIIQRVQFDRATANVYKSNAFIPFDKVIYLDRYAERNFEALATRRAKVVELKAQEAHHKAKIDEMMRNKSYPMPWPDMLEATATVLQSQQIQEADQYMYKEAIEYLVDEAQSVRVSVQEHLQEMNKIQSSIKAQYSDLQQDTYVIHAVFIHQGEANYGHYWVYMYDKPADQWWKYNDSYVTKVEEAIVFQDTYGSTANPYCLVYVKNEEADALVETVAKKNPPPPVSVPISTTDLAPGLALQPV